MLPNIKCLAFKFEQIPFIIVRDCYPALFSLIITRKSPIRVALSGTPGIGKTCFLMYFLWRLLRSELQSSHKFPRILFHNTRGNRFVLEVDGSVLPLIDQPGYAEAQSTYPDMWYLVDSAEPELTPYLNILLVTSLNQNLVKHHYKDAIPFATWYMPLWTDLEINLLLAATGDSPTVRANQKKFGNVPRSLFISKEDYLPVVERDWSIAVGEFTRRSLISILSGSEKEARIFHLVVHVEVPEWSRIDPNTNLPKNDFTTISLKFASEMSQEAIARNLCEFRSQELESLLNAAAANPIFASLYDAFACYL